MLTLNLFKPLGDLCLDLELTIPAQGVTAISGRSGAGKSSLINLIAGLTTPQKGRISLNGRTLFDSEKGINLPPEKRQIGYVFQEPRLFPHYTVEQNLKYGCKRSNFSQILPICELLGIAHLLARFPNSLSGGEKQRVAIGRALLTSPDILLMDEPLSALDLPRKQELLAYLDQLAERLQIPILYVTHSLDEIIRLADRLILLENGKVLAFDSVERIWHSPIFAEWQPESSQKISLLALPIVEKQPQYQMLGLGLNEQILWVNAQPRHQIGDNIRITIASKEVAVSREKPAQSSIRNILLGNITAIEPQEKWVDLQVEVAENPIWASVSHWAFAELGFVVGQAVYLQIKSVSL